MAQASFNTAATAQGNAALDLQLLAEAESALPDLYKIKNLLKAGADIETRNAKGHTPLIVAAGKRNAGALELLAQSGANLYASMPDGVSAMFYSLAHDNFDMVKKLLDNGYDPERQTLKGGLTALMWAANLGKLDLAEEIAKRGGDVYRKHADSGETALDYASKKPHIVKALTEIAARIAAEKLQQQRDAEARAMQAIADAEKAKLDNICKAGIPTAKGVKRLKPVSFKKQP
ncbi:MAG: ankyrin repeat domain-containing protein [Micavibrio sp.]|nr:ankyrin repeat domain-containing protein [Micavibrio sp.]